MATHLTRKEAYDLMERMLRRLSKALDLQQTEQVLHYSLAIAAIREASKS